MRLVKPSVEEITPRKYDMESVMKHIERCARTCYKSTDKITDDSYAKFCQMLKSSKHLSTYEHGTIYLVVPNEVRVNGYVYGNNFSQLESNPYTWHEVCRENTYYTTNLRVIVENDLDGVLQYMGEPTVLHATRKTFKIITDRGVTAEMNRHRVNSPSEESTRYCNFSKEKFGSEISILVPPEFDEERILHCIQSWTPTKEITEDSQKDAFKEMCNYIAQLECFDEPNDLVNADLWLFANMASEFAYMGLIKQGWKPQQARRVLPLDLKSEIVVTAFGYDWEKFLKLRTAEDAHPDIRIIAEGISNFIHK